MLYIKYKYMTNILITGGCGFIASNFLNIMKSKYPYLNFVNIDSLNYCSNKNNVREGVATFIKGNICDIDLVQRILKEYKIDTVFHFAAQSHVDNSFISPLCKILLLFRIHYIMFIQKHQAAHGVCQMM